MLPARSSNEMMSDTIYVGATYLEGDAHVCKSDGDVLPDTAHAFQAADDREPRSWRFCKLPANVQSSYDPGSLLPQLPPTKRPVAEVKVYTLISTTPRVKHGNDTPAPMTLAVSTRVDELSIQDFNKWYDEEHVEMMARIPGWTRTRRFRRLDSATAAEGQVEYLALYEFQAENNGLNGPVHKAASATPATARIRDLLRWKDNRLWQRHICSE